MTVFLKLLNVSITASWLVLAVLLLRLALKKAPRWISCLLWGLVGLRLVFPFSIESALSLIPSAETVPPAILYDRAPAIQSGIAAVDRVVNPVITGNFAPEPAASVNPLQVVTWVVSRVWVIGLAVMLIYAAVSFLALKSRMRTATLLEGNIRQSDRTDSPFVLGILRPVIYLPYTVAEEDLEYVIAHEKAHVARRDHWWKPIGFILLAVYWFNPLMWLAYILLCRDIEAACDEKVVAGMEKEGRQAYSVALLNCSIRRRAVTACPLAFGETGVKGRIKGVMSYKKPAVWIIVAALLICAVTAVCFLTNPKEEEQPDDPQPSQTQMPTDVERLMEAFQRGVPEGVPTRWVVAEDGAWDLLGAVLFTDEDGDPCWLAFVDEDEVCQTVGFSGEGELTVAEQSELTYLGGGGVSLNLVRARSGETFEYQLHFSRTENDIHIRAGSSEEKEEAPAAHDVFDPAQYGITEGQLKLTDGDLPRFSEMSLPALVSYYLHTDGAGAEGSSDELYRRFMTDPGEIIEYLGLYGGSGYERDGQTVNQNVNMAISDAIATAAVFWYDSADEMRAQLRLCPVGEGGGERQAVAHLLAALDAAELRYGPRIQRTYWELDGPYTEQNNPGLSLRGEFGSALGDYGASLTLGDDGSIDFQIGLISGVGTYGPDGDTGRMAAEVDFYVGTPESTQRTFILYEHRESPDSTTYLIMDYDGDSLFWKEVQDG